jgi:hypothetical protein
MLLVCAAVYPLGAQTSGSSDGSDQPQSLADIARSLRKNKPAEVVIRPEDAKELFRSVDEIFKFASEDTGLPQKNPVKRRLIGQADVEKFVRERVSSKDYDERFTRSEMTMKKFGLLPREFDLRGFLVKSDTQQVAAYYDDETKIISMLNWVPLDEQKPVLAHELTHALQDQNFDLRKWAKAGTHAASVKPNGRFEVDDDESISVRHAVAEGQAMVVYYDYILAPMGRNMKNAPGLISAMEDPSIRAVVDTPMMHSAPMVLREQGAFPYRDGLIFIGTLLQHSGKEAAFEGALSHPPHTTHEILQPEAYMHPEKLPALPIPDVRPVIADKYTMYDSGVFGELDVRALLKQLGNRRVADDIAANWQGGAYLAFAPVDPSTKDAKAVAPKTASDVALLYVSHWKTPEAAQKFAKLYADGVGKRYKTSEVRQSAACNAGADCNKWNMEITTEEGPVIISEWPDNTLVISESFDESTAAKLRNAMSEPGASENAGFISPEELGTRLEWLPAFRGLQEQIGRDFLEGLAGRQSDGR